MGNTHERIIAAAKELFERRGFAASTTKEIASLAGVSEVTLFRHFENKRRLFEETLHSCLHPYEIDKYLENDAAYDLRTDLTQIAYKIKETYHKNAPIMRMIMRDKVRDSVHELRFKSDENSSKQLLIAYFEKMHGLGKISADPNMAATFYISNVLGYLMKQILSGHTIDEEYFAWMLDKVIGVLKS
ncbi:MAG: TetR/AcrR family transcriptional regulator [Burkholderiales bacterium]